MDSRINRIRTRLADLETDAVLLTALPDVRWACGFTGSNGVLLVLRDDAVFLTDGRYSVQSEREIRGARVVVAGYDLPGYAAEHDLLAGCRAATFQSDHLTVAAHERLRELFEGIDWRGEEGLLSVDVASKDDVEIERIAAAQRLTEQVFTDILGWIREGMTEAEVAAEITYRHLRSGAERMSFDPIVASGANSALPHARPTDRRIRQGDVLLLDFGCFLDGYASDMTRIVSMGKPAPKVRAVYDVVLEAQEQAISAARAGLQSADLDETARGMITEAGYGEYFSHGLGHGLGIQIHEWPRVSYSADYALPLDCAVTIEPGVYLPGRFGIRIEDIVVLREASCDNLTRATKDLVEL